MRLIPLVMVFVVAGGCATHESPSGRSFSEWSSPTAGANITHFALFEVMSDGQLQVGTGHGVAEGERGGLCGVTDWNITRNGEMIADARAFLGGGYWSFPPYEVMVTATSAGPVRVDRPLVAGEATGTVDVRKGDVMAIRTAVGGETAAEAYPSVAFRGIPLRTVSEGCGSFWCGAAWATLDGSGTTTGPGLAVYSGSRHLTTSQGTIAAVFAGVSRGDVECTVTLGSEELSSAGSACAVEVGGSAGEVTLAASQAGTDGIVAWFLSDLPTPDAVLAKREK